MAEAMLMILNLILASGPAEASSVKEFPYTAP